MVTLRSKEDPSKTLLVGNTHLFFKPPADQVRLLQAATCIRHLEHLAKETDAAVVLAGDFNSTPECGVFQLATTGKVSSHEELIFLIPE